MRKKEEKEFYRNLDMIFQNSEEIYKLTNMIQKYCETKPDSADLYEVSGLIEIINKNLMNLSLSIYRLIHKNDELILVKNDKHRIIGYINKNSF